MEHYVRLFLAIAFAIGMLFLVKDYKYKSVAVPFAIVAWCGYALVTSFAFAGYAGFIYLMLQFGALFALVNCKPEGHAPYIKFYTLTILAFIITVGLPIESWFQVWVTLTTICSIVGYKDLKTLHEKMHGNL